MKHARRVVDDLPYAHFITYSVVRRRKLLDLDHPKRIVLGCLNQQLETFTAKCIGFVIMPESL